MATNGSKGVHTVDSLVGKTLLSRSSGNKIGEIGDLIVEPIEGQLLGLAVTPHEGESGVVDSRKIHSFGKDAVMINDDHSVNALQDSSLSKYPRAKKNLIGAKIITEGGKLLGEIANVILLTGPSPASIIYEVRESLLDKLLRRAVFIPASYGLAVSDNTERFIVPDDVMEYATDNIDEMMSHFDQPSIEGKTVVRGRATPAMHAFREGVIEFSEVAEESVISKRPRVTEEVIVSTNVTDKVEVVKDTVRGTDVTIERISGEQLKE